MNGIQLIERVRANTRDLTRTVFREIDIISYLDESVDRIGQVIPELSGMGLMTKNTTNITLLPPMYHHLLATYSSARCFAQDDRHYQAGTLMNEFETKLAVLQTKIEIGEIVIIDPITGNPVLSTRKPEYIVNAYFGKNNRKHNFDDFDGVDY